MMGSKTNQAIARSAHQNIKLQVLESELAALTKEQAEMDNIRLEQHADLEAAQYDLELGLGEERQTCNTLLTTMDLQQQQVAR